MNGEDNVKIKYTYYDISKNIYVNKDDIRKCNSGLFRVRNPITDHEKLLAIKDNIVMY